MEKMVNLVLCKHYKTDIARVFELPEDEEVRVGDNLLCDTAKAEDQQVVAVCDNFLLPEESIEDYLGWLGTSRKALKPITGKIMAEKFVKKAEAEPPKVELKKEEAKEFPVDKDDSKTPVEMFISILRGDDEPEEKELRKLPEGTTLEDLLELVNQGAEVISMYAKSLRNNKYPKECPHVVDGLYEINDHLFDAAMKAFALDLAATIGGPLLEEEEEEKK